MEYEIKGTPFPVVICQLNKGESMLCESGAMAFMDSCMEMSTTSNGGFSKAFGRMFTGESLFINTYTANNNGKIAFAPRFPGEIRKYDIEPGKELIVQKSSFLACEPSVQREVFFNKKVMTGLFGGEGFIMNKFYGNGTLFVEIDGSCIEYYLNKGEQMIIDTGYVALMDATCSMTIESIKGAKNILFGGEALYNTVVTGPGRVLIQTMPISTLVGALRPYFPSNNG